jgi:hypothetical protein
LRRTFFGCEAFSVNRLKPFGNVLANAQAGGNTVSVGPLEPNAEIVRAGQKSRGFPIAEPGPRATRSAFPALGACLLDDQSRFTKATPADVPRLPALGASFPIPKSSPPEKRSAPPAAVAMRHAGRRLGRAFLSASRAATEPVLAVIARSSLKFPIVRPTLFGL